MRLTLPDLSKEADNLLNLTQVLVISVKTRE